MLCKALNVDQKFISVNNHGSLQVDISLQSASNLLMSHLEGTGCTWNLYLQPAVHSLVLRNIGYSFILPYVFTTPR